MGNQNEDYIKVMQKANRWKGAFLGLVILIAGLLCGSGVTLIATKNKLQQKPDVVEWKNRRILGRIRQQLSLTPEQGKRVDEIVSDRMKKLDEIRRKAKPEVTKQLDLMNKEVAEVLGPRQKEQWQKIVKSIKLKLTRGSGHRRHRGKRRGPGMKHPDDPNRPPDKFQPEPLPHG